MDVSRLIAEIHQRPALWDSRNGEHKARYCIPTLWKEVARNVGVDVPVEQCKRKWKNLRDAYRAEVRRSERRIERDRITGEYDPNTNYTSKWVYFEPMSFICDSKRPRYTIDYDHANSSDNNDHYQHQHDDGLPYDTQHHNSDRMYEDYKREPTHITHEGETYTGYSMEDDDENVDRRDVDVDDDDEAANDMLFEEFQNLATPQAARRLSATISLANAMEHNMAHKFQQDEPPDNNTTSSTDKSTSNKKSENCNCSKSTDDQVHFLEDLEKEEQKLIMSTRKDITRSNKLDHVGDSDYNFLVSFLPQMKKMTELENLQFRARMCDMVLNILAPSISANPSPIPLPSLPFESRNATPTITYLEPESSGEKYKETDNESENNIATSTSSNHY